MGGSRPVLTPTLALPHRGGGERLAALTGDIPTAVSVEGKGEEVMRAELPLTWRLRQL